MTGQGWLEVNCPELACGAVVGEVCRNLSTGGSLEHRPAHEKRLWNADALGLIELDYSTAYPADEGDPWAVPS